VRFEATETAAIDPLRLDDERREVGRQIDGRFLFLGSTAVGLGSRFCPRSGDQNGWSFPRPARRWRDDR
jgi:hypothetical protein